MKKNIGSDRRPVRCFVSTTARMCDFLKFPSCLHDSQSFQHSPLEVDHGPSSDLGTDFNALDARATREAEEKKKHVETPQVTKYLQDRLLKTLPDTPFDCMLLQAWKHHKLLMTLCQTKETLKKFLNSMMSKAGKLRHLVRDLKKSYSDSATATYLDHQQ